MQRGGTTRLHRAAAGCCILVNFIISIDFIDFPSRESTGGAAHDLSSRLASCAQQELQRRAVERLWVLVQSGMGQVIEDHKLAVCDRAGQRLCKSR